MKRNTSNWSNFGMLLRRAGLTASAGRWAFLLFLQTTEQMSTNVDGAETSTDNKSVVLANTLPVTLMTSGTTDRPVVRLTLAPVTPAHCVDGTTSSRITALGLLQRRTASRQRRRRADVWIGMTENRPPALSTTQTALPSHQHTAVM